jgi:hypothetical protein
VNWMEDTFAAFWSEARWSVAFTNAMLLPAPPHVQELMGLHKKRERCGEEFWTAFNAQRPSFHGYWIPRVQGA